jgi:ketosteroid isomerase-like protein
MKADAGTEAAVIKTMNRLVDSYKMRDIEALAACFAPDSDVVMYGTGADEKRIGLEEIRFQAQRDWDQSDAISMAFNETSVSAAGRVAWVASDGSFKIRAGGQEFTAPTRLSVVLEKRNGDWLVVHAHFSVPAGGQEEGDSIPA